MPMISGPITQDGAVISILVGVSENRRQRLINAGFSMPPSIPVLAVIDTGSFATGVRPEIFRTLGVESLDSIPVLTPSTKHDAPHLCDWYHVSLTLASDMTHKYLPSIFAIAREGFGEHGIQALIGRDVLNHCVFSYFGPHATFELSF